MDLTHLTPGLPYALRSLRFDLSFEKIYKELYGTLKAYERIEIKETIVHGCQNLFSSLHLFVPWSIFVFFPSFPFVCELAIERWRIQVVEDCVCLEFKGRLSVAG